MADATNPDPYDATIDWDDYWRGADDDDRAAASPVAMHADEVLAAFLAETGVPDAVADVGCGAGAAAFHVAERFPETTVVGYDAAAPALAANRERADERGIDDVSFERAVLPDFAPDRRFGVVFSYFTLCYVRDVERALEHLYDAVAPGGYLVVNYQTEGARERWREMAGGPDERFADSPFDPDTFEERFAALLAGDSVLSAERIEAVLGTAPERVWSVVDRPDTRWAWDDHPLVSVPK